MRTAADKVDVASDRRRRKNVQNEFCLTYRKVLSDKMQYINMQKRQI